MPADPTCQSWTNRAPTTPRLRVLVQSRPCRRPLETRRVLLRDVPGLRGRHRRSLANARGSYVPLRLGDFVMCEFGADHSGNEIWLRILPDNAHLTHVLELQSGKR